MSVKKTVEAMGLDEGTLARVEKDGRGYKAITTDGTDITEAVPTFTMKNAFRAGSAIKLHITTTNRAQWRQVSIHEFGATVDVDLPTDNDNVEVDDVKKYLNMAPELKPDDLMIAPISWKFALRTVLRGESMLVIGPSGCGKTLLANALAEATNRMDKFFYVNLGASQDARSTIIGNTHFDPAKGTFVAESYFAQAIQIPNAIILLDETSRAHPDAINILLTVLDEKQRYLRVDEMVDSKTIKVAAGVSFILTANVGAEYTGTRVIDRALLDRCVLFEIPALEHTQEFTNLKSKYPSLPAETLDALAEIAHKTRVEVKSDYPKVSTIISTRMVEKWASTILDGFSLLDSAEVCVFPFFSDSGGSDSERTWIRQVVQKFNVNKSPEKSGPTTSPVSRPF